MCPKDLFAVYSLQNIWWREDKCYKRERKEGEIDRMTQDNCSDEKRKKPDTVRNPHEASSSVHHWITGNEFSFV